MAKNKIKVKEILPNHLAIYVRVSTDKQVKKGYSMQDQIENGITKANELGWSYQIFDDSGESGDTEWMEREGIRNLINLLESGKIGGLYTVKIDRLSRDGDYIEPQVLITKLKKSGIRVFTGSGESNYSNEAEEMAGRMQGLFASYERQLIKSRTSAGARNSIIKGNTAGGGGLILYGYEVENKKLVIDEEQAKVIRQIFAWYLEGKGSLAIAGMLNDRGIPTKRNLAKTVNGNMTVKRSVTNKKTGEKEVVSIVKKAKDFRWVDSVVNNIIRNTTYKGEKKWADLIVPVPAIIDANTFDTVQVLLKDKKRFKREPYAKDGKVVNRFLLKGLIRCGECGQSFWGHKRVDLKDKAYKCLSIRHKGEWCGNRGIGIDYLENLVWENLLSFEKEVIKTYKFMESSDGVKMYKEIVKKGNDIISANTQYILELSRNFNEGKIKENVYHSLLLEYENEIEVQQKLIKDTENDNYLMIHKKEILGIVKAYTNEMKTSTTFDEKQSYIRAFVDYIIVMANTTEGENYYHDIFIYYKLDQFSQFHLKKEINVKYKKNWHKISTESKSLKILMHQEVKNSNTNSGEIETITGF